MAQQLTCSGWSHPLSQIPPKFFYQANLPRYRVANHRTRSDMHRHSPMVHTDHPGTKSSNPWSFVNGCCLPFCHCAHSDNSDDCISNFPLFVIFSHSNLFPAYYSKDVLTCHILFLFGVPEMNRSCDPTETYSPVSLGYFVLPTWEMGGNGIDRSDLLPGATRSRGTGASFFVSPVHSEIPYYRNSPVASSRNEHMDVLLYR